MARSGKKVMKRFNAIILSSACALGFASSVSYGADPAVDYAGERLEAMERALMLTGIVEVYGDYSFVEGASGNANNNFNGSNDLDSYPEVGGSVRLSVPFADRFSGQIDLDGEVRVFDEDDADNDHYYGSYAGTLHVSYRNPSSYLLGVFGGAGRLDYVQEHLADFWYGGLEAQYYFDQATLYGQAGYLTSDDVHNDGLHNAWFMRGVGRYFWSDYSMAQAEIAYVDGEQDTDDQDMYGVSWGLRVEHQFMPVPVSLFAAYEGNYFENEDSGDDGDFTEHSFLIGAKYAFGATGLKANDRYGATLDTPGFGRWVAAGNELD